MEEQVGHLAGEREEDLDGLRARLKSRSAASESATSSVKFEGDEALSDSSSLQTFAFSEVVLLQHSLDLHSDNR